ncbi:SIRB1 protein, partial [Chunga burmeisteri]|nr:SIRB1 protein [Chunga burmeisteri]
DAQVGQGFELRQPQDKVSVAAGETLTLICTMSGNGPAGGVKWLKGWGSANETVYDQKGSFPRVTRAMSGSNTDFSILIRDVRPEDAGTYYCVKFSRSVVGAVEVFRRGKGTEVSLHETALVPSVVAAVVVLCFLLLLLFVALCMYRRKRRGEAESQCLARLAAMGSLSPMPLRCCAGTPSTPRISCDSIHHLCTLLQQSSKEDNEIHYADLQPLPTAPRHGRSPGTACSEYASVRVAAK